MRDTNGYAKKPSKVTKVAGISFDIGDDSEPTLSDKEWNLEMKKADRGLKSRPDVLRTIEKNVPAMRQKYGIKGV